MTAFSIDGGFFLKRLRYLRGSLEPHEAAEVLYKLVNGHLGWKGQKRHRLYRVFYYDCPPLAIRGQNPVSLRQFDWAKTETAKWQVAFHDELRKRRQLALRLGYVNTDTAQWTLAGTRLKDVLRGRVELTSLAESDVRYDARQKGVDIRIGIDIASMAYKRQVDQIVLVSGDSDFVPAAKLARREGIDFILDPMWANIRSDLNEHIDGKRSVLPKRNERIEGEQASGDGS